MKNLKLVSGIFLGMILVFSLALVAWADGSSAPGSGTSGGSGSSGGSGTVITQSVAPPTGDSNNAASVDDQKKQKGFDPGFPEVDPSGAFQYQYPINLPPGTNNMAPSLSLFYNSNSPNGMLGMGWTLNGIAKIERDYSYPVTYNDTTDHFMYNGEKLVPDANGYYHPAKESYERIQLVYPNSGSSYWVITHKNGTKMYFGQTTSTNGRVEGIGVSGSDIVIVWSLSKVIDLQANYCIVEYIIDGSTGAYYRRGLLIPKMTAIRLLKTGR